MNPETKSKTKYYISIHDEMHLLYEVKKAHQYLEKKG